MEQKTIESHINEAVALGMNSIESGFQAPCQDPSLMAIVKDLSNRGETCLPILNAWNAGRNVSQSILTAGALA